MAMLNKHQCNDRAADKSLNRRWLLALLLLLLFPVLTVLLSFIGHERIAQFMLIMTGPMVAVFVPTWRRCRTATAPTVPDKPRS